MTQGLRDVTSKELVKPMIPIPNTDRNNPKRGLGFPVNNAPVSARSKKANNRRQKKNIVADVQIGNRDWWNVQFQRPTADTVELHDSKPQPTELEPSNMICLHTDTGPTPLETNAPSNADIADNGSGQRWDPWECDETWLDALLQMRTGFTVQHDPHDPTTPRRLWKIQGLHKFAVPKP